MTDSTKPGDHLGDKPGAWVDLALTLPVFLAYHLGVVFLPMKNASDYVTRPLLDLANGNRGGYLAITVSIGVIFAGIFALLGRGHAFRPVKFLQIAAEGIAYAIAMRVGAGYLVGRLPIGGMKDVDPVTGTVMSLGAGFYEEIAFRVILFGLGARLLVWLFARPSAKDSGKLAFRALALTLGWSVVAAAVFSGAHYVGALGDTPQIGSFVFRLVLGLALTLIYRARGFAAAVWAHAAYDIWVMVL
jgi:hypothetical protein